LLNAISRSDASAVTDARSVSDIATVYMYTVRLFSAKQYNTKCYFSVYSKADIRQLNLPRGTKKIKK